MKVHLAKNPALADAALVHSTEAYNELILLERRADAHDDLVRTIELVADGLEADGRTMDGMTKAAAAAKLRALLAKVGEAA